MKPGPARRITILVACAVIVLGGLYLITERPWIGDHERIERCAKLQHARDRSLERQGRSDTHWSLDDARTYCRLEAANNNLNYKGGRKRS
jgi:hypothetical protein